MRSPIHLITREYPYGAGEPFVEEEVIRLMAHGPVIVVPAGESDGRLRELPSGAQLDRSLMDKGWSGVLRPTILFPMLGAFLREILESPSLLIRPRALFAVLVYWIRGSRTVDWLRNTVQGRAVELALCFWSNAESFGMAMGLKDRKDVVLLCRSHRFDVWASENPYGHLPFRRVIMTHCTRSLPSSQRAAEHLRKLFPRAAQRIREVPLAVDRPLDPDPLRKRDDIVVLTCSTARPVKRLDLVARSIRSAALADQGRQWTWIHLGQGMDLIRAETTARPANLTVELPGPVPRMEVFRYLKERQPDVFVNLSRSEGVPVSIMEALSMGVPVVATAAGGTAELVDDQVGAILPVEIGAEEAGAAILRVANSARELRVAALERWDRRASPSVAQTALDKVIDELRGKQA